MEPDRGRSALQRRLDGLKPIDLLERWPVDSPVLMLHSGLPHPRWARWSIVGVLDERSWLTIDESDGESAVMQMEEEFSSTLAKPACVQPAYCSVPFSTGWIGFLSYDLGRVIEPAAAGTSLPIDDRHWPLAQFAYCPAAFVYDHLAESWHIVGDHDRAFAIVDQFDVAGHDDRDFRAGEIRSAAPPDAHLDAIARAKEYIAAGDIFQANITQRLSANFAGSTRALAREALIASGAHYGAYLELPGGRSIVSMSPELFIEVHHRGPRRAPEEELEDRCARFDALAEFRNLCANTNKGSTSSSSPWPSVALRGESCSTITTRPIKGTRPASADPSELRDSIKDAAELHMIVDLMRNDLGRVCEYGSVRVPVPRAIETHPTVHHGVAEITGTLRAHASITDLIRATFPGGSVTGAPKIRAMQIIDDLERLRGRRGPYCGAVGFIGDDGAATLNIAIRTIALTGRRGPERWDCFDEAALDYGTGGGIVADSDPAAEYRETLDKAEILRMVLARRNEGVASAR